MFDDAWSWSEFADELSKEYEEVTPRGPLGIRYVLTGEYPSLPTFTPEGLAAWAVARITPSYRHVDLALTIGEWRLYAAMGLGKVMVVAMYTRFAYDRHMEMPQFYAEQEESIDYVSSGRAGWDALLMQTN